MRRPTITESETHVVLFTAGFLGRGFDSRRLHHYLLRLIIYLQTLDIMRGSERHGYVKYIMPSIVGEQKENTDWGIEGECRGQSFTHYDPVVTQRSQSTIEERPVMAEDYRIGEACETDRRRGQEGPSPTSDRN
jgi:hypothetical protein